MLEKFENVLVGPYKFLCLWYHLFLILGLHHVSGRSGKFAALKNCLNFELVWRSEIEPSFLLLLLGAIQNIAFIWWKFLMPLSDYNFFKFKACLGNMLFILSAQVIC